MANKECARRLGRDIRTVQRELARNNVRVATGSNDWEIIYEPKHAQFVADQRKYKAYDAKVPLKSKRVYGYVMDHLKDGWSPEQIAGRLRLDHSGKREWRICHETIYKFIYRKKTGRPKRA